MSLKPMPLRQKTTGPAPWPPSAWPQPAHCPRPMRAASPGCGPTTCRIGKPGAACKRSGGTHRAAWARQWPQGLTTPPSPLGCKPTATTHAGAAAAACPQPCTPLPRVKKVRCKAWPSSAAKREAGFALQRLLALIKRPPAKPTSASKSTVDPAICSTPISAAKPSTHAKQSLIKNNIRPL